MKYEREDESSKPKENGKDKKVVKNEKKKLKNKHEEESLKFVGFEEKKLPRWIEMEDEDTLSEEETKKEKVIIKPLGFAVIKAYKEEPKAKPIVKPTIIKREMIEAKKVVKDEVKALKKIEEVEEPVFEGKPLKVL
jgi:hypothetical protein